MFKSLITAGAMLVISIISTAQPVPKITVPSFNDKYSRTVKELEAGKLTTDFRAFRESFLESKQYKIAAAKKKIADSLEKAMYVEVDKSNYPAVVRITKQLLSIDYTNMQAHKILRQTYTMAGDTVSARKYHDIQFGLLNSIVRSGNGKSCETGWHIVQPSEETFIIKMLEAKVQQRVENKPVHCDKVDVVVDGKNKTYYFNTSLMAAADGKDQ